MARRWEEPPDSFRTIWRLSTGKSSAISGRSFVDEDQGGGVRNRAGADQSGSRAIDGWRCVLAGRWQTPWRGTLIMRKGRRATGAGQHFQRLQRGSHSGVPGRQGPGVPSSGSCHSSRSNSHRPRRRKSGVRDSPWRSPLSRYPDEGRPAAIEASAKPTCVW